jgi:hypothetical protein
VWRQPPQIFERRMRRKAGALGAALVDAFDLLLDAIEFSPRSIETGNVSDFFDDVALRDGCIDFLSGRDERSIVVRALQLLKLARDDGFLGLKLNELLSACCRERASVRVRLDRALKFAACLRR